MVNSIEDIINLHKSSGNIEDAYVKIYFDDKILNLNIFTLNITAVEASKNDVELWNSKISEELEKNKGLEKEVNEFRSVFELFNRLKIKSGKITKFEKPDFIIEKQGKTNGIEVTKIYVGYEWAAEKLKKEINEYDINAIDAEGYIEYKKMSDKVEIFNRNGKFDIAPKIIDELNEEYQIIIKNKIFEKIRKQLDDYKICDNNIIYAEITSPEYFEEITDLDNFLNDISFYIEHLEGNLDFANYILIVKLNRKCIKFNLNDRSYELI